MAKDVVITQNDLYAAKIFFNAAVPLLRVVVDDYPNIKKKFVGKSFVFQMSALYADAPKGKMATYFVVDNGNWTCHINDVHPKPDIEFEFGNLKKFIYFFANRNLPANLPKIRGFSKLGKLISVLMGLLKMAGLLQSDSIPKKPEDQRELVKLYLYLLPNGISQLNKAGYKKVTDWTKGSPDRTWALSVSGDDELNSWIRIKDGKSKSGRGICTRAVPFLTMTFDNPEHALQVMLGQANMIEYIKKCYLKINGAPEMGNQLGDLMFAVGDFAKGLYLDEQDGKK